MTTQELITQFELYLDDGTELSSSEELSLANKIYRKVLNNRPWNFLKKEFTGTVSGGVVTLPSDFKYIYANAGRTGLDDKGDYSSKPIVLFVGSNYTPYKVINFSDRRQYRNNQNVCYISPSMNTIKFTSTVTNGTPIEFDYIYRPDDLTLSTRPVWDSDFDSIITHGMAADDYMIQQFDKARSYAAENMAQFKNYLTDMQYQDMQFNLD